MDKLKLNPFLVEVEALLKSFGIDIESIKQTVPNATLFDFNFNDIPVYICIPSTLLSPYSSVARIEAEIAEFEEIEAGQLVVAIAAYLQIEDCTPVRVTTKRSKGKRMKILIEFVSDLRLLQLGALAMMLTHSCELADQIRTELVEGTWKAA